MQRIHLPILGKGIKGIGLIRNLLRRELYVEDYAYGKIMI